MGVIGKAILVALSLPAAWYVGVWFRAVVDGPPLPNAGPAVVAGLATVLIIVTTLALLPKRTEDI